MITVTNGLLYSRPFIWVRDSEKAGILAKIATNAWATSVYNGMVSRVAADVASHQSNRDAFLRGLPVDWTPRPPSSKPFPPIRKLGALPGGSQVQRRLGLRGPLLPDGRCQIRPLRGGHPAQLR